MARLEAQLEATQQKLNEAMQANMQLAGAIARRDAENSELAASNRVLEGMVERYLKTK